MIDRNDSAEGEISNIEQSRDDQPELTLTRGPLEAGAIGGPPRQNEAPARLLAGNKAESSERLLQQANRVAGHQMSAAKPERACSLGAEQTSGEQMAENGPLARCELQSAKLVATKQQVFGPIVMQHSEGSVYGDDNNNNNNNGGDDSDTRRVSSARSRASKRIDEGHGVKSSSEVDSDIEDAKFTRRDARLATQQLSDGQETATDGKQAQQANADCKMETTDSSANNDDERNGPGSDCERRYRPQKYCAVCGDKAIACNFNAVTCESCKAFFRRNAFKEQRLRCLFENRCLIDRVTRRFCSKCRLLKCLQIGMKREWILTDEQKQIKRVKIMQNKQTRQQQQQVSTTNTIVTNRCSDEVTESRPSSGTSSCQGGSSQQQQQGDLVSPEGHQQLRAGRRQMVETRDAATSCPDESDLLSGHILPYCSLAHQCQFCSFRLIPTAASHQQTLTQPPSIGHYQSSSEAAFSQQQQSFQHHHSHHQPQPAMNQPSHHHYHYQQASAPTSAAQYNPQGQQQQQHHQATLNNCYNFSPAPVTPGQLGAHQHGESMLHHQYHYHHSGGNRGVVCANPGAAAAASPHPVVSHALTNSECCCSSSVASPASSSQHTNHIQTSAQILRGPLQNLSGVNQAAGGQLTFAVEPAASGAPSFMSGCLTPGTMTGVPHLHMIELLQARVQPLNGSGDPSIARVGVLQQVEQTPICLDHHAVSNCNEPTARGPESNNPVRHDGVKLVSSGRDNGCAGGGGCKSSPADYKNTGDSEIKISESMNGAHETRASEAAASPVTSSDCGDSDTGNCLSQPTAGWNAKTNYITWKGELFGEPAMNEPEIRARVEQLEFSDSEQRIIYEMVDATRIIFEANDRTQNDSSLDDIVFFCDLALRRLIKAVKKINAFRMLTMDDQIMLLKNACFKILLVRSSVHYQDEFEGWIDKGGATLPLKSLKTEKCQNYERHKELLERLAPPLRRDRLVMAFLVLVILFDPTVTLKHANSVSLDNIVYLCTLRKYLVRTQPEPLAKYERLVEVLQLVSACNEEYNLFFSRKYQPEQITPLLIEIFDISVNDQMR